MRSRRVATLTALLTVAASGIGVSGHPLPAAPHCRVFPRDNPWNQRVDGLPVHHRSAAIVRSIGLNETLHSDFGSGLWDGGPIGIPFTTVGGDQDKVPVRFVYAGESDPGPYPIPADAPIEGGSGSDGDRHVIVVDRAECKLYEMFDAHARTGGTSWKAGSGAVWDLDLNRMRPLNWTSADAAGLPILPGLVRFSDVRTGRIDHALRFTASRTRRAFVYPARHFASSLTNRNLPAMGQRFRLEKSFDVSTFPYQARVVLRALKQYGMIVADNGSDWFISGSPSAHWNNDALHKLSRVTGEHLEVVKVSSLRP
ncbi:MAG: hypothetical protein H0W55_02890 [Actinobacteria bacterium]|nr:hypothetical protein [Actinomycetota bacterium]MDQ3530889.1 hypothetical protein [Actinomycetota bacterium]